MTKRLLSLLLALVTVFSLSIPAYAESGEPVDVPEILEAVEPEAPAEAPTEAEPPAELDEVPAEPEEFIEVIAINAPTEFAEAEEEKPTDEIVLLSADEPQTLAAVKNGLVKDSDGVMRYYTNGKVDTTKTGVAQLADKSSGSWYYVEKGVFKKATGIAQRADKSNTNWYYIKDGVYTKATGIAQKADKSSSAWYYVQNGQYVKKTGIAQKADKSSSAWYYVKNGVYTKATGIAQKADKSSSTWYYVKNGVYTQATGVAQKADKSSSTWYYVQNGVYTKTYTGLAPRISDGKLFYVKNGAYLSTFNGQVTYKGKTYTVKNGAAVVSSGSAAKLNTPTLYSVVHAANGIKITWGAVSGAAKYRVFYKTGNSGWTKAGDTANASTNYTWSGAKSGATYTFTVRCLSADGKSYTSDFDTTGITYKYVTVPASGLSGTVGDNLTWKLAADGTLTVSGKGSMGDSYSYGWDNYRELITSVVIENGVTSIGSIAFQSCVNLTSVSIPSSVTSIGTYAFNICSSLTKLTIPAGVTEIGNGAFAQSSNLTLSVASGNKSFTMVDGVLFSADKTVLVQYPGGKAGSSYTIPSGVKEVRVWAFMGAALDSITLPASLTSWNDAGRDFNSINVASGNKYYASVDGVLFNAAKTELIQYPNAREATSYTIPGTVTSIADSAFFATHNLTSVTIPKGVATIGNNAFVYCTGLKSVTLPDSVTEIGYNTFQGCQSLKGITIPKSVTKIGSNSFSGCPSDLVISGYKGSTAQTFATENGITFKALG